MGDGHTIDVGVVHVLEAHGGGCVNHCPHPQHVAERIRACRINEIASDFGTYRNVVFDGTQYEHAADLLDALRNDPSPQASSTQENVEKPS